MSLGKRNTNMSDQSQGRGEASLKPSSPYPFLLPAANGPPQGERQDCPQGLAWKKTHPVSERQKVVQATPKSCLWAINKQDLDAG